MQLRVHSKVAIRILKMWPNLIRCYTFWLFFRAYTRTSNIKRDDAIRLLHAETELTKKQIRNLINRGDGIFWEMRDDGYIWFKNKERVFFGFGFTYETPEELPGKTVYIDSDKLLHKRISVVRAHLHMLRGNEEHWMSRSQIKKITGRTRPTQIKYERITNTEVEDSISDKPRITETGYVTDRLPNVYRSRRRTPTKNYGEKKGFKKVMAGDRSGEDRSNYEHTDDSNNTFKRLRFNSLNSAVKSVNFRSERKHEHGQVLAKIGEGRGYNGRKRFQYQTIYY